MTMERTLALIKPDIVATRWIGEVITRIERADLAVIAMRMQSLSQSDLDTLYHEHRVRLFFADLCAFMREAPVVAMVLEGENAVVRYRALMGATNSNKAERGTIRCSYGGKPDPLNSPIYRNAVHGSDGAAAAEREIRQFFPDLAPVRDWPVSFEASIGNVPVIITGPIGACDGSGRLANKQRCDGCRACC